MVNREIERGSPLASFLSPVLPLTICSSRVGIQTTELVVINSSVPRGIGPQPRAIKRRNGQYLRPRIPDSPLSRIQRERKEASASGRVGISGSFAARISNDYAWTKVKKLKVQPLQIIAPQTSKTQSDSSCWSPTFPDMQVKSMDLRQAPTFDPLGNHTSSFSQLHSLDLLPALGLAESDFWNLFSKCAVCHNFMTTRTVPYHKCPGRDAEHKVSTEIISTSFFLRLLDVHDVGHEAGVPENIFKAIFYVCGHCGRYMTERISFSHNEDADSDSEDSEDSDSESTSCIYLRAGMVPSKVRVLDMLHPYTSTGSV